MPANREKSGRFAKGCSGNPSGRPARSETEKAMLEEIYQLSGLAVQTIKGILEDSTAPANVRLRCAEIVLERVAGKPMNIQQIENNEDALHFDFGNF